ncbi:MAG: helix-turn-helix transcriptional regulator [Candidatus Lokiarchaeota archaeon]|nr:helix-turn-helix transcriptional regulator [Candidatus Lokiarchaeota archaeon]
MEPEKKNHNEEKSPPPNFEESFYYALNHEIRRSIIRLIGENGKGSFTQFKRSLDISTGTLYHHLDVLKTLVVQDQKKKYILSTIGKHAYDFLIKNYDSMESVKVEEQKTVSNFLNKIFNLAPKRAIELINNKIHYGWIISSAIVVIFYTLIVIGGINSSYIFFLAYHDDDLTIGIRLWLGAKFLISLVLVIGFSELLCRFLYKKTENTVRFVATFSLGLFPMIIYLVIHTILAFVNPIFLEGIVIKIIMVVFQIWTILLISYIQIVTKFIKIERSLLITFLIHYIAFNILLFTSI